MLPLFPVPCMDAPMPRAHGCAGAATQGFFRLLVQEKVAKEKDTPDGANTPAHPRFRDPALILRGILPRRSGADILSAPPSGRSPGPVGCAGAPYGDPRKAHTSDLCFCCLRCSAHPGVRFKLIADS